MELRLRHALAIVLFVTGRGRKFPRLFTIAGGAAFFSVVVQLLIWVGATFTSPDDWDSRTRYFPDDALVGLPEEMVHRHFYYFDYENEEMSRDIIAAALNGG